MHLYLCKWAEAHILHEQMILGGNQWAAGLELIDYAHTNNYAGKIAQFRAMEVRKSWQNCKLFNYLILNRHWICLGCWARCGGRRKHVRLCISLLISLDMMHILISLDICISLLMPIAWSLLFPSLVTLLCVGYCWVWSALNYFTIINKRIIRQLESLSAPSTH